ncbi:hypothetical protein Hypma_015060 [Hypsizygus marmoreus]|uniref:Uncharacterized protein n=1 Tax=Hypsizygus marmoreus TaxID=39966 RepID=A0A369KD67_HYPMA|nr:hypothetical protein Hypma_015060 [Hypsizygus marmoreus]
MILISQIPSLRSSFAARVTSFNRLWAPRPRQSPKIPTAPFYTSQPLPAHISLHPLSQLEISHYGRFHFSRSPLSKLGKIKYIEWEKSMYGRLLSLGCSRIALGTEVAPALVATDPASVTAVNAFNQRSDRRAGEIYQWLDEGNKIHVDAIRDNPAEMWKKLKSRLVQHSQEGRESLTDLATRVEGSMQRVKALRADHHGHDPSLPREDYNSFISSVLLLTTLTKDAVSKRSALRKPSAGAEEDAQIEATAAAAAAALV